MNFINMKSAIAKQFALMSKGQLFVVESDKDEIWKTYLLGFPAGSNPIYKTRTEHDCSCCKHFIRNVGNVVSIIDGKLVSIWDVVIPNEPAYQQVANKMSSYVKSKKIVDEFVCSEKTIGTDKNFEQQVNKVVTHDHFFVNVDSKFIKRKDDIGTYLGEVRSTVQVFSRSLTELSMESIDTVLELIQQNSLYRGEEHKFAVSEFRKLKKAFEESEDKELFVWQNLKSAPNSVLRIRNTSIGALLTDLSNGKELEESVKAFEAMVAPANYKRPTSLVTKAMVDKAKATIEELGLTSALSRRYASLTDITVNNILFANRSAKSVIEGDVFDEIATKVKPKKKLDRVEEVTIEKFISEVLPTAKTVEIMVENKHQNNFVSLVAPVDPTARELFKWSNNFSWSYNGDLADSDLRKAVQARGGSVEGVFRFSHQWNYDKRNASLMDLHVFLPANHAKPENGINDSYGNSERVGWNNRRHYASGGVQDVDYVQEAPIGYIPVENITFPSLAKMPEGTYVCKIHNWNLRQPTQGGFKAEIEFDGQVFQYEYDKPLKHKEWITVAEVTLKNGQFKIKHHLPEATSTKKIWGVSTFSYTPVSVIMHSPNHWDGHGVGNKHYFFMLQDCVNEGSARGFYNEFLKEDLTKHRKVLELVGSKMRTEETPNQLSGVGFSSTAKNELLCKVTGAFTRELKIVF